MVGLNERMGNIFINMSTSYLAPNVILASQSLILGFSLMDFTSRRINQIAASVFAVVLVHGFHMDEIFKPLVIYLYETNAFIFVLKIFLMMLAYVAISVVMDKGRIYLWSKIYFLFSK